MPENPFSIIILAAGKGKRMNNPNLPKVMALLDGEPLIKHVLDCSQELLPSKIVLVVGHHKEIVIQYIESLGISSIHCVEQAEQLGTGHAVAQAEPILNNFKGNALILCGDVPLLRASTLQKFISLHNEASADVSVLSTIAPNPFAYGRIVRDEQNNFKKIVEEKDSTESEKLINEINSGVYFVNCELLFSSLKAVSNVNAQGEYYLTDIISILNRQGKKVCAFACADFDEIQGVNSPEDLANVERNFIKYKK